MLTILFRTGWFLATGHSPRKAFWLARHDAPTGVSYRQIPWAWLRAAKESGGTWEDLVISGGSLRSRALGLDCAASPLLQGLGFGELREAKALGWSFQAEGPAILAQGHGVTLRLEIAEEVHLLHEIFVQDCYGLAVPGRWRVLDIGGNAGFAALSFAVRPEVSEVLSFEPFGPTAEAYRRNLLLNPALGPKIQLRPVGLSDQDGEVTADYVPELRGSMSTAGLGQWREASDVRSVPVTLRLRRASEELRAWIGQSSDPIFAKVDCEGAEYQILPELAAAGLLTRLKVLIIEWHGDRHEELVKLLTEAGYSVRITPLSTDRKVLGLLLAHRLP